MRALDNASINDQVDVNGGHQPTELESGTGQVISRYVKLLPKYDGARRMCDRKNRKGWDDGSALDALIDGGVNCRAVLKSYTFIGFGTLFFTSSLLRNNSESSQNSL